MSKSVPWMLAALIALVLAGCDARVRTVSTKSVETESKFVEAKSRFLESTVTSLVAPPSHAEKNPNVLGAAIALSGLGHPFNDTPLKGTQLTIIDINARGGVLVRPPMLAVSDTESDIERSKLAARELLKHSAEMIMVSCVMLDGPPAIREMQSAGKIAFSSCALHPNFSIANFGPRIYSMMLSPGLQGATLAEWAFKEKDGAMSIW